MANTAVYATEFATRLQDRLDKPTNWSEVLEVIYTDVRVIDRPYLSTSPAVQTSQTRGSAYTYQDWGQTADTITISNYEALPLFVDRADLAQSTFETQMGWADYEAQVINERMEAVMLAGHSDWKDIGDSAGVPTLDVATAITITESNIDDVITAIQREIYVANGGPLFHRNGGFFVWRPADFEKLTKFMMANGFNSADHALLEGTIPGTSFMGFDHYVSNDHTANHVFAGVKKTYALGILKSTYGQIVIIQDPAKISGIGIVSRVDYARKKFNNVAGLMYDINVA